MREIPKFVDLNNGSIAMLSNHPQPRMRPLLGKRTLRAESVFMLRAFTLVELLVVIAIVAVLAGLALAALPGLQQRADRADALAKTRTMGQAVLQYVPDHAGKLPPLFPGQVLEFRDRPGRIVKECAPYLGLAEASGSFLVQWLMPKAYARLKVPANQMDMRVWVMNSSLTNDLEPFGGITNGRVDGKSLPLASISGFFNTWMISTADQEQPNVAGASWKTNAPPKPPLGRVRAVFRFDGSAGLVNIGQP
jgi:prepilin-type N-terminal cleavage/methylation domain-containing protein